MRDGLAPAGAKPTFEVASPPLAEVVRDINKFSNNVMAQQLFLTLGLTQRGTGTPEAARDVLNRWLDERFGNDAAGRGDRQRLGPVARHAAVGRAAGAAAAMGVGIARDARAGGVAAGRRGSTARCADRRRRSAART